MSLSLSIQISDRPEIEDESVDGESLIELKRMLHEKMKKKMTRKALIEGPLPFRGSGLSGTVSPAVTPLSLPFLD